MRLRFLLAWGPYRKGDVTEPPSRMQAQSLLAIVFYGRRVAEEVAEPVAPPVPPAVPVSPALVTAPPPARGRRRKS